jgi:NAD(P) transhydrogenase subunit alpha
VVVVGHHLQGTCVPSMEEVGLMREGSTLISFIWPAQNPELMQQLAANATVLAIDSLPRTLSRAQKMDALTSQAGVAGYRAVIEAANAFGRFFNGQITAAGKVPPAKVFIAGAGVAGLAAIGTAANLGAIVRANDTRAEVADQVASLGGEFVKVDYEEEGSGGGGYAKVMSEGFQKAQREMYAKQAREVDIIITTALIPGKPAPRLITAEMVKSMKAGQRHRRHGGRQGRQLRADRARPGGGEARRDHRRLHRPGLSRLAKQSSTLYSTNLFRLTEELCKTKDGIIDVNMEDEAIRGLTVIKEGECHLAAPGAEAVGDPASGGEAGGCGGCREEGRMVTARVANRCRRRNWRSSLRCRGALLVRRRARAGSLPRPLHGLRAGLFRRLHGGLERHARFAHAADERDQRDQQHHRHRCPGADCAALAEARRPQ